MATTATRRHADTGWWVKQGAIGGAVAGIIFAMFEMLATALLNGAAAFFMPLRMIGAIVLGQGALQPSYPLLTAGLVGLVVHMMLSVVFGIVFALLVAYVPALANSALALLAAASTYGLLLWLVNFYISSPRRPAGSGSPRAIRWCSSSPTPSCSARPSGSTSTASGRVAGRSRRSRATASGWGAVRQCGASGAASAMRRRAACRDHWNEQVVVVTGASSGVGRACARAFGARGAKVALLARNEGALNAAAGEVRGAGGEALVCPLDVADAAAVERPPPRWRPGGGASTPGSTSRWRRSSRR